jgi:RNA polymerase sigma factor (sigma-70 family)
MSEDTELLNHYVSDRSESAFTELTRRHIDLVYSAALRLLSGDVHRAQDVTQQVFTELARRARQLTGHPALVGWLYTTTRQMALRAIRTEQRRKAREQEAHSMNEVLHDPTSPSDWGHLRPVLDEAMHGLSENDRLAVLLRFFQNKNFKEVGDALGTSDNTARMRVERAIEKLRAQLARKGVSSTASALALTLAGNAVAATPAGLAVNIASIAVASAAAGTGTTLSLIKIMGITKLKMGLASTLLITSVATTWVLEKQAQARLRDRTVTIQEQSNQLSQLRVDHDLLNNLASQAKAPSSNDGFELQKLQAEIVPLRKQAEVVTALRQEEQRLKALLAQAEKDVQNAETNWQSTTNSVQLNEKIHYAMSLTLAMHEYASKHDGAFPTNLEDVVPFFREEDQGQTNVSSSQFEIAFHGSRKDIAKYAHPDQIILVKEKEPWRNIDGKWLITWSDLRGAGYHFCPADGKFEDWVNQHTVPVATQSQ